MMLIYRVCLEGILGYKVLLSIYRVCLEGILGYKVMLSIYRVYLEKAPWCSLLVTN